MKINSMKMTIIIMLIMFLMGVMFGLFFKPVPEGNVDVIYMFVGMILGMLSSAITTMFRKEL